MTVVLQALYLIFLYAAFAVLHTVLAGLDIKRRIAKKYPGIMPWYRLLYNIFAIISFYYVYELSPRIDIKLYDLQYPYDFIILFFQLQMLLGILWTLRYFNAKEFFGIDQILRKLKGSYNALSLDENSELIIKGPYLWCRHPLYLFFILFLALRPYMFLDYLISLICITLYFYIGSIYEEKRMIDKFGDHYREYIKHIPRLIPYHIFFKKNKG